MNDQYAQITANALSTMAVQLEALTKVMVSINEKLARIELRSDSRAPGH